MLLDNRKTGKVGDALRDFLTKDSQLSVITSQFSIHAFDVLQKELHKLVNVRLLLSGMAARGATNDCLRDESGLLFGNRFERRFRNRLIQQQVAKVCMEWLINKVEIRAAVHSDIVSQNLLHVKTQNTNVAIQGSSDFTTSGLGYCESDHYDMNTFLSDAESTTALREWFDTIWNDTRAVTDVKDRILKQLNRMVDHHPPEFIYFLMLFHLFNDLLGNLDEESIIKTKTGFKDTQIWNKLYKFQRDGVLGAIDKIEKYNGCIIADSVGLGKTFEALAVIKYYELRNDRVLVLCPKILRENWTIYTINDKRNIFSVDRFNFDVLNHTDLTRLSGMSGEINLQTINWGNYDLVVIDESHNFRNNNPRKDGMTRYARLMNHIIKAGVKTKVLMLSATPVNNRMNDLKNQVAFITEGQDDAFFGLGIYSIEQSLRKAQTLFNRWLTLEDDQRNIDSLLEMMNFDYFKLLDLLTIARSRKHIEKYYDTAETGEFPERQKPINIKADIDLKALYPPLKEVNRTIRKLNLSAYSPLTYVRLDKRIEYGQKYDMATKGGSVFRQVDREQSLIHLMRVNLLKRMESSIVSFAITLERLLAEVDGLLEKLRNHNSEVAGELAIADVDIEDDELEDYLIGSKIKVLIKDLDAIRWQQALEEDRERLTRLLEQAREIDAGRDAKLQHLKRVITHKIENPINPGNRKIIIFTAFADTANYLYDHIADWARQHLSVHAALVVGTGRNKTTMPAIRKDLNSLITSFSPRSKERAKMETDLTDEIDILIATDCISEGQNLQDCDCLINYDIHWNPVRIIQRFGRVDRLGSENKVIQLINFWPNMELDEYINLEARVSGRMVLLDISATGEENVIEYDERKRMNDLAYRRKQLQKLQDSVIDLEEIPGGISITDLTLNDFRMDLSEYMKTDLATLERTPFGIYTVKQLDPDRYLADPDLAPGVIFCLKDMSGKAADDTTYALSPHYLVYVTDQGEVRNNFQQSKKILDVLKKQCIGRSRPSESAVAALNSRTQNGKEMGHYQALLECAVNSIVGKHEEKGVESLFRRGGTVLSPNTFQGIDDFEVVAYLILLDGGTDA